VVNAHISEKYLAGFLDADGCVKVFIPKTCVTPRISLNFSQRRDRANILECIQGTYGGSLTERVTDGRQYAYLEIKQDAKEILSRIQQYLVIKRHYAGVILGTLGKKIGKDELRTMMKEQRKVKSLPIPKHPTRKWLAGYFDGDGCLSGSLLRSGTARVRAHIGAWEYDTEGLELAQKAFGGSIRHQGSNFQWYIDMDASKAIQFLEFFGAHSVVKRNQIDVVLGHARSKHFREGEELIRILKALNAKPQRLSESTPKGDAIV